MTLPLLVLLLGCHPVATPPPNVTDPAALVSRAQAEPASGPRFAPFSVVLSTPGQTVALSGSLVVAAPDRFRVDLRGPIGPVQVSVACDGHQVSVWFAPKSRFYHTGDADALLTTLLGSGEPLQGASVATSLLLGRFPTLPGEPALTAAGPVATASWTRADGARFSVGVDSRTAHLVDATTVNAAGVPQFSAAWEPGEDPKALRVTLPTLGTTADVRFDAWSAATPPESAFVLAAPAGAETLPFPLGQKPE